MSDPGVALQGIWTLLDMLGSLARKAIRGDRTTLGREWRSSGNGWLGIATLIMIVLGGFLVWAFIAI